MNDEERIRRCLNRKGGHYGFGEIPELPYSGDVFRFQRKLEEKSEGEQARLWRHFRAEVFTPWCTMMSEGRRGHVYYNSSTGEYEQIPLHKMLTKTRLIGMLQERVPTIETIMYFILFVFNEFSGTDSFLRAYDVFRVKFHDPEPYEDGTVDSSHEILEFNRRLKERAENMFMVSFIHLTPYSKDSISLPVLFDYLKYDRTPMNRRYVRCKPHKRKDGYYVGAFVRHTSPGEFGGWFRVDEDAHINDDND